MRRTATTRRTSRTRWFGRCRRSNCWTRWAGPRGRRSGSRAWSRACGPANCRASRPASTGSRPTTASGSCRSFGKPVRSLSCDCERSDDATLDQTFQLLTGPVLNRMLTEPDNRIGRLLAAGKSNGEIVQELYFAALDRPPSAKEQAGALALIARGSRSAAGAGRCIMGPGEREGVPVAAVRRPTEERGMQIPVLIEPVAPNGFRARSGEPLGLTAEGATREEALQKLRELVTRRIADGPRSSRGCGGDRQPVASDGRHLEGRRSARRGMETDHGGEPHARPTPTRITYEPLRPGHGRPDICSRTAIRW